jgi:hypothetical protein
MNKLYIRTCTECQKEFQSKSQRAKYCCEQCFKNATNRGAKTNYSKRLSKKNCKICNSEFEGTDKKNTCSNCQGKRLQYKTQKKEVRIVCKKCSKLLKTVQKSDIHQSTTQKGGTCDLCKNESRARASERMKKNNPNPLTGRAKPKIIKQTKDQISQRMKEKNPMFQKEIREKTSKTIKERIQNGEITYKTGKEHHNWKGNRDRAQVIRSRLYKLWTLPIMKRDGFKCCSCQKQGGRLEVHHIDPSFREILKKCLENRDINLLTDDEFECLIEDVIEQHKTCLGITYCVDCHKKIDPCRH